VWDQEEGSEKSYEKKCRIKKGNNGKILPSIGGGVGVRKKDRTVLAIG